MEDSNGKKISTSSSVEQNPSQLPEKGNEISTSSSVEEKPSQLPEEGKEISTSSSVDRGIAVERDIEGQEMEDSKGKKISTSSVEQKKKPALKFGTIGREELKALEGKEPSTSPVDQQKRELPDKSLKGKEISTSPDKHKGQLPGKETSTSPSVEQKPTQLPEKGKEKSTSSSVDIVHRDIEGQEMEDSKGKKISTSSVEQKKKPALKFGRKERRECVNVGIPLSGKKVLLVDDDLVLLQNATSLLRKFGATVDSFSNGKDAYDHVSKLLSDKVGFEGHCTGKHIPYDYILMDCEMPMMDGYRVAKSIRDVEGFYGEVRIPIIAMTENINEEGEVRKSTKDAGMNSLVIKPLTIEKLTNAIVKLRIV